jgi:putative transposase
VVLDQFTGRLVGFGVHASNVDGVALCRMFNRVISGKKPTSYLSFDHDALFEYQRWQLNLRILEIEPVKTVPFTPISHPFVERLIGTVRREFLDYTLFWNTVDLQRKLESFQDYYNRSRFHAWLDGDTPAQVNGQSRTNAADLEHYCWQTHCGGVVQLPVEA